MIDQHSFERGLLLGLRTALSVVRDGGGAATLERHVVDLKEAIELRRNGGRQAVVEMSAADIFETVQLAHPGDFGMPSTPSEDAAVAASKLRPQIERRGVGL